MLTTISYSESDIVALREMAELQYHTAYEKTVNEAVTVDESDYNFDEIFMENCVYAGYSMDEAVDAAMQKHKLLNSQEMKLVKRLASQTRKAVKKGDYETALSLAKKRLAHLENMVKRAEDIDDDEQFIIAAETLVKSYIVTIIATHLIIAIVNGLLPGSGPIVSMIKKALNAFKLTDIKQQLAGKGFMTVVEKIAAKYITISGTAKLTGSYIGAHKQRKWANTRAGDVNREVNAGRPDTTHMSVSRTEAKVKLNKLIKAQQEEIKTLEANVKTKPTNESAEILDEGLLKKFGGYIKAEQEKERTRLEKERAKHADEYDAAYQKQRLANRKATDRERQEIKNAVAIKNGNYSVELPPFSALAAAGVPISDVEAYLFKNAKKQPEEIKAFLTDLDLNLEYADLDEETSKIAAENQKKVTRELNRHLNDDIYVIFSSKYTIQMYCAKEHSVYVAYADINAGRYPGDGISVDKYNSLKDYLMQDRYSGYSNMKSDDVSFYKRLLKSSVNESTEVLDEGIFGASKYAKQFAGLLKTAHAVKNGTANGQIPSLEALSYIKCDPKIIENYFRKIAKKDPKIFDDFMSYVSNELDEDDERISALNRKLVPHKNNPIVNLHANHPAKSEIFFYDASDNMIYQVSEDDDFDFNRTSVSAQLKESYPDIFEKDYKKAMKIAGIKESTNVLDEKIFGSPMLDMIKKRKEKKAKLAADREAAWKRAKTEVSVALSVKNGKMPDTTPHPAALAFVKCPPDIVEKYAQAKAKKNPKVIEDQIDGMNEYIEMYYDDNDTKEYEPEEYAKLEKDRKYVEDYLKKAMTHRVFFFDTYSDRVSPLCYYDADTKTWVETGYYEAEAYVNEFYLSEMLKEEEKALRESFMQDRVSLYRRALQSLKNQLSESVEVLDEKFFKHSSGSTAKKPKKKKVKQVAISEQDRKNANKDIRAALDIKNGKSTKYVPNMYALAFVQCTPETLEKHMQSNATKNPRAIQNQINRMNAYLKTYYSDNNIKEDDPETYKNLEDDRNYVESYLKDAVNHRLFFFDTEPDPDYSFGFYDVDSRKWIETGYNDGEIFLNELSVAEILEICNRMLKEGFMQAKVAVYKKALQSIKSELSESITLNEAKLKAAERNELPDSAFGIPSKRKFPLNDPAHVKAAVKMFRHASPADRPELARRIKRAIKKFNLDIEIGEDNPLHEYK